MPVVLTHPGVYIEEVPSGVRTISGVSTSTALFVGWAARGPTDRALRLNKFRDYEDAYGGLDLRTLLGYAVRQFFDNGGSDAYVLRVTENDTATAACSIDDLDIEASSPGDWATDYQVRLTRRPDDATRFRLDVLHVPSQGAVVETFENLSMTDADSRFVEAMVNERSAFIVVDATTANAPANATVDLDATTAGGVGTVIGPGDANFHAAVLASFGAGTITDRIDIFNLVCVPGLTDGPTISTLQTRCHERRAFLIVDSTDSDTVGTVLGTLAAANITGADALNSAFFFPWVRASDPLQNGALRAFPPCGYVAGICARTDGSRGVWKAPAGSEASLTGVSGLVITMSDAENGQLNPHAVNCLRTLPVYGTVLWGSRTLHGDNDRGSEWKYVPVRRMALFLEESLYRGTQWVVFEPNDEPLWAQIRLNVGAFMQNLFRQGAFQGKSPREAYFVRCDSSTTTQADINLGIVNILVGFAPLKPAEFVVVKIQQIAGDIPT
jgi:phage tail sheath protein FI